MPPPLGDTDAHVVVVPNDAARNGPCDPPQQGCPCTLGSDPIYCGTVYRYSAGRTDCSKGYLTCQADGGYGPCEGATIFTGD